MNTWFFKNFIASGSDKKKGAAIHGRALRFRRLISPVSRRIPSTGIHSLAARPHPSAEGMLPLVKRLDLLRGQKIADIQQVVDSSQPDLGP